jgi:hypothetical protein
MRIEHQELVHLVTQHYYINSVEKLDDLSERDQQQIAIAVLKDNREFDSCEILLYHDDPARNMIAVLEAHWHQKITADEVIKKIYTIILNSAKQDIDKIFNEFAEHDYWDRLYETGKAYQKFIENKLKEQAHYER